MTETCEKPEAAQLTTVVQELVESRPESITGALNERGVTREALEEYARSPLPAEELESLRQLVLQAGMTGNRGDARLSARMQQFLDPRQRAWQRIMRARDADEMLEAMVTEVVKGGVVVDVGIGIRGFVPASHATLGGSRNMEPLLGQTLRLKILEVNRGKHTVVLSHRIVAETERAEKRKQTLTELTEGEIRDGIVRRLTDIGAFVDVGGIDGLLHVSEISWKRVEKPSDVLKQGQRIQVKIIRLDRDAGRISLSIRRLEADPWGEISRKCGLGKAAKVCVSKLVSGGAVVDLAEGFEGFIPLSELAARRLSKPDEAVAVGQEVEAVVIDTRDRRIVLSVRQVEQAQQRQNFDAYRQRSSNQNEVGRMTIGELIGDKLSALKQVLAEEEGSAENGAGERDVPQESAEQTEHAEHTEHAEQIEQSTETPAAAGTSPTGG